MVELGGSAELADVAFGGFVGDAEGGGNGDVGGTVERGGQGGEETGTHGFGELTGALGGLALMGMARERLEDIGGVLQ